MTRRTQYTCIGIGLFVAVVVVSSTTGIFVRWRGPLLNATAGADRIEIIPTSPHDPRMPIEVRGRDRVDALLDLIEIDALRSNDHCKCWGETEFAFYKDDQHLVTIAFAHGTRLKWPNGRWPHDAILTAQAQADLLQWLDQQGYPYAEEVRLMTEQDGDQP